MKVRVLTALEAQHEPVIVAQLGSLGEYDLVRRCPDLHDLVAACAAGLADIAVISAGLPGIERDALAHVIESGVAIIGLTVSEEDERRLRQLGIVAILPADSTAQELDRAVRSLRAGAATAAQAGPLSDADIEDDAGWAALEAGLDPRGAARVLNGSGLPEPPDSGAPVGAGRVLAVWGATGSPGRTTVAANLAAELALAGRSVLLIDADTYGAAVGQHLGLLDEAPGLAAAARAAELGTLDLPVLARLAPTLEPGFRVLTGLPSAARWPEVRADSLAHILNLARSLVELTIVDCGFCLEDDEELSYDTRAPRRNAATLTVLAEADAVVAVGAGDPVGLQRLVRGMGELSRVVTTPVTVVVNRVRASAAGISPERAIEETLERFASIKVDLVIPEDRSAYDKAVLAGRLLHEIAPKSPARSRIRTLATEVGRVPEPAAAGASARRFGIRRGGLGRWSPA